MLDRSKLGNLQLFDPNSGYHVIDILPYFTGPNDPVKEEGSPTYLIDLYVHRYIGPKEDDFICLYQTFNKPCPICEHRNKLRRQDEPHNEEARLQWRAEIEACRAKRYSVYAI